MAKQRANKYDKKVKLNVPFHDAVNILMNGKAKSNNHNTMIITVTSEWNPLGGKLIPENHNISVLCESSDIEAKINYGVNQRIYNIAKGQHIEIDKSVLSGIKPAFLYLRSVNSDLAEDLVEVKWLSK